MINRYRDRLTLAGRALLGSLCEPDLLPQGYETAHNIGRWWDAVLRLENTCGFQLPEKINKAMLINIRALTSNRRGMLLNDSEIMGRTQLNLHNLREGLLAYAGLVQYRGSKWAAQKGHNLLETIDALYFSNTITFNMLAQEMDLYISDDPMITRPDSDPFMAEDDTPTNGRCLEAMLRFWQASGDSLALEVAHKTAAFHLAHTLNTDGSTPDFIKSEIHVGHNHSYLGTLRGLLLYGILLNKPEYIESVYNTVIHSVFVYNCSYSGFAPHDIACLRFPDSNGDPVGDHASCADVIQLLIWLAGDCGYTHLFEDAERLIRGRLFRSQITNGSTETNGAWGIYSGYFGQGCTLDVFAAVASVLAETYRYIMNVKDGSLYINLHFDSHTEYASLISDRGDNAVLRLTLKRQIPVYIRLPSWSQLIKINAQDIAVPFSVKNGYALIETSDIKADTVIEITYDLPEQITVEKAWRSGIAYEIHWKGNDITDVVIK
ncbi:MAG: hypothetical protein ACYCWE_16270 [Eubacteriales bacterium]